MYTIIIIPFPSVEGNGILKLHGFVYTIIVVVVVRQGVYLAHFSRYLDETWRDDRAWHEELDI